MITLYIGLISIHVREPWFQKLPKWAFIVRSGGDNGSQNKCKSRNRWRSRKRKSSGFKDGLNNPLEVILQVPNYKRVGGVRNNKRSDDRCNNRSRSKCCNGSRGGTIAILGKSSASELVFAVKKRILARITTSGGLSHWTGWVGALTRSSNKELLNIAKSSSSSLSKRAGYLLGLELLELWTTNLV